MLKSVANKIPDAPTAEDMTYEDIPNSVLNFLMWVLSDDDTMTQSSSANLMRRIMSIVQDLKIYGT